MAVGLTSEQEPLALDLSLDSGFPEHRARRRIKANVVSIFDNEAADEEFKKRVHAYSWEVRDVGQRLMIVSPEWDEQVDVREVGEGHEQQPFYLLADELLMRNDRIAAVWISPPKEKCPESRVFVGTSKNNGWGLDCLGISTNWDEDKCLRVAEDLSDEEFKNGEELREKMFLFSMPDEITRVAFLGERIPDLQEVWNWIGSGGMSKRQMEIEVKAEVEINKIWPELRKAQSDWDYVRVGARLEGGMAEIFPMRMNTGCGLLNTALMAMTVPGGYGDGAYFNSLGGLYGAMGYNGNYYQMYPSEVNFGFNGWWRKNELPKPQYVEKCPFCKTKYNRVLHPGFICDGWLDEEKKKKCGQKFLGIC